MIICIDNNEDDLAEAFFRETDFLYDPSVVPEIAIAD